MAKIKKKIYCTLTQKFIDGQGYPFEFSKAKELFTERGVNYKYEVRRILGRIEKADLNINFDWSAGISARQFVNKEDYVLCRPE